MILLKNYYFCYKIQPKSGKTQDPLPNNFGRQLSNCVFFTIVLYIELHWCTKRKVPFETCLRRKMAIFRSRFDVLGVVFLFDDL